MSGYSPTWTNKGSDKLRALQATKILLNSLKRIRSLSPQDWEEREISSGILLYSLLKTDQQLLLFKRELLEVN